MYIGNKLVEAIYVGEKAVDTLYKGIQQGAKLNQNVSIGTAKIGVNFKIA